VPLEFLHPPSNLEITSDYPFQAQVTLRGPAHMLQEVRPSQVHALLDLEGAKTGERTFDLSSAQVQVPHDVKVVQVVPAQIRINFDPSATRTVAVQPRVIGTLLSGYGMKEPVAVPPQVTIVGPERRVDTVVAAMTDPVDATGVVGSATFTTHAYVADPLVRVQTPGPIYVTVTTEKSSKRK
jgi:YbbR domain-containing protein